MPRPAWQISLFILLGDLFFRLLSVTVRRRFHGEEAVRQAAAAQGGAIFAFWHSRLLLGPLAHRGRRTAGMISRHGDGEIIARIIERHGVTAARGSSTRGGSAAYDEMIRLARSGWNELAVTPDGPRGPRHEAKAGAVRLAAATGYALVPCSVSARPGRFLGSWDRFLLPYPFARLEVVYGPPMRVAAGMDEAGFEAVRLELQAAMIAAEEEADRRAGWSR